MSVFESYLFEKTVTPLTEWQIEEIEELSSRIEVTRHDAFVVYNYGNFAHNSIEILTQYFDCFRYYFQGAGGRLAFCFYVESIDLDKLKSFEFEDAISLHYFGDKVVLEVSLFTEEPYITGEYDFTKKTNPFTAFHEDITLGDYRWLEIVRYFAIKQKYGNNNDDAISFSLQPQPFQQRHWLLAEFFLERPAAIKAIEEMTYAEECVPFCPDDWLDILPRNMMRPIITTLLHNPQNAQEMLTAELRKLYRRNAEPLDMSVISSVREINQRMKQTEPSEA